MWRIGELARRTGLTVRTLRHYDDLGLLVPGERTAGDYRLYSVDDLDRLLSIQHLESLGLSLEEIGAALDDPDYDATEVLARHVLVVEGRLAAEQDLLARLRALQARPQVGWEEVVDIIALTERLRHADASVRLRALFDAPTTAPVDVLIDALRTETEPGVRDVLTWGLAQHGGAALDPVLAEAGHPDPALRRQVAHILSKLRDPRAVPTLGRLLGDEDPGVRAKAAFALGRIGGSEAIRQLVSGLADDDPVVADAAVVALAHLGSGAVAPLADQVAAADPRVRRGAVEALGAIGEGAATLPLVQALADPDPEVGLAALLGLGGLDNDEAGRAIEKALDSPDERTRLLARRLRPGSGGQEG
ncbi:MAG: HEAT repeat domain-containing protein [Propioniciclava sp.]